MENTIYEWLYDHYAEPRLRELPEFGADALEPLLKDVPEENRLDRTDQLEWLRLQCATAAFEAGVRLGLALQADVRRL